MRFPSLLRPALLALILSLAASASAQIVVGQKIGVDINSTTSEDGSPPNWTSVDAFTTGIQALNLNTGSAISGVTIAFASSGTGATGGFNDLGGTAASNAITGFPTQITSDGAYGTATSGPNTLTLTFSGLNTALTYTLEIFSVSNLNTSADTPSINGTDVAWASGFGSRGARYNQTTGAIFTGLTTDSSGNLSFAITDAINSNAIMNGAVLTATSAIPEPSTYAALAGLGALGLAVWRKRRSTRAG